jgi:hypothetical protein
MEKFSDKKENMRNGIQNKKKYLDLFLNVCMNLNFRDEIFIRERV